MDTLNSRLTLSPLLRSVRGLSHGFTNKKITKEELDQLDAGTATAKQVHGHELIWATQFEKRARDADGVATLIPGLSVGVYSADCTPLLSVATDSNGTPFAVMAVHAGWRGTAAGIGEKTLRAFAEKALALHPDAQFLSAIGPCIGPQSFEVGEEVVQAFPHSEERGLAKFLRLEEGKKKFLFNLPGENLRQLQGVKKELGLSLKIDSIAHCTLARAEEYPSYRRDREKAGRILSFIRLHG